jgi:hypothetical protein
LPAGAGDSPWLALAVFFHNLDNSIKDQEIELGLYDKFEVIVIGRLQHA